MQTLDLGPCRREQAKQSVTRAPAVLLPGRTQKKRGRVSKKNLHREDHGQHHPLQPTGGSDPSVREQTGGPTKCAPPAQGVYAAAERRKCCSMLPRGCAWETWYCGAEARHGRPQMMRFCSCGVSERGRPWRQREDCWFPRGWWQGGMGGTADGHGLSSGGDEHVLELDGGEECTAL